MIAPIMTDDQRFAQWQAWIRTVHDDVQDILFKRQVVTEVRGIIAANPAIQKPSVFYDWMRSAYITSQVIGVRRQVDTHRKAVSLLKLLLEIRHYPNAVSRDRHVALWFTTLGPSSGNWSFDKLAGSGASRYDPPMVQPDITQLSYATNKLEKYASMRIAHQDAGQPPIPTFEELDAALDLLHALVNKYMILLWARDDDIIPIIQHDWKAIFRVAWAP